jgi:hypothetical protein
VRAGVVLRAGWLARSQAAPDASEAISALTPDRNPSWASTPSQRQQTATRPHDRHAVMRFRPGHGLAAVVFSLQWSTVGLTDSEATRLTPDPTGWASHLESPPLVCLRRRPCCRRSEVAGRGNGFPPRGITLMCRLSPFPSAFLVEPQPSADWTDLSQPSVVNRVSTPPTDQPTDRSTMHILRLRRLPPSSFDGAELGGRFPRRDRNPPVDERDERAGNLPSASSPCLAARCSKEARRRSTARTFMTCKSTSRRANEQAQADDA